MKIHFTKKQKDLLISEAREKYPVEACGLLIGEKKRNETIVRKIVFLPNILKSSHTFQINPKEVLKALFKSKKERKLVGFFHSHPAAPHPSNTDIKYMKLWPDMIWLIVSSIDNNIAAYQIVRNTFQKATVKID